MRSEWVYQNPKEATVHFDNGQPTITWLMLTDFVKATRDRYLNAAKLVFDDDNMINPELLPGQQKNEEQIEEY